LISAEATVGIGLSPCPIDIDDNVETMLSAAKAVSSRRLDLNLVDSGSQRIAPLHAYGISTFPDFNFSVTFPIPVVANAHFPHSNPLSLNDGVWRNVEVLNVYPVSSTTVSPSPLCGHYIYSLREQHRQQTH